MQWFWIERIKNGAIHVLCALQFSLTLQKFTNIMQFFTQKEFHVTDYSILVSLFSKKAKIFAMPPSVNRTFCFDPDPAKQYSTSSICPTLAQLLPQVNTPLPPPKPSESWSISFQEKTPVLQQLETIKKVMAIEFKIIICSVLQWSADGSWGIFEAGPPPFHHSAPERQVEIIREYTFRLGSTLSFLLVIGSLIDRD